MELIISNSKIKPQNWSGRSTSWEKKMTIWEMKITFWREHCHQSWKSKSKKFLYIFCTFLFKFVYIFDENSQKTGHFWQFLMNIHKLFNENSAKWTFLYVFHVESQPFERKFWKHHKFLNIFDINHKSAQKCEHFCTFSKAKFLS